MNTRPSLLPRTPLTRVEIPDYTMGLRGKLLRSEKTSVDALSSFCTIHYGFSLVDEVTDTPFSNSANGYPDARLHYDEDTRIALPWRPGSDAVIADLVTNDGTPFGASPRGALQRLLARYDARGLTPMLGYEFEFWIFHDDDRDRAAGEVEPIGRTTNAYSLQRVTAIADLIEEFIARMDSVGVPVEAFHSELGPGLFEFTLSPQPALRAADGAARARQYMRELCAERGMSASFMAKPFGNESGAGGHIHSSLVSGGENVFSHSPGELSEIGSHYLAGLLATMGDVMALFAPFINSYKRIDPTQFVSNHATWGLDDRSAACRVLLSAVSSARVEHRLPGADTSPYFSAVALLAGGIVGLEKGCDLTREAAAAKDRVLPRSLSEATERFAASPIVRELLGDMFVDAIAAVQRSEIQAYENWLSAHITSWERSRHLEHH